jgi:hypothetical protein
VLGREYPQAIEVAYEGVGGELRMAVFEQLSPNGRLLSVGYISEYPHVKSDADDDVNSEPSTNRSCNSSSTNLPPAHELFWQRKVIKRGGQTLYGDVWAGVSMPPPHGSQNEGLRLLLRDCCSSIGANGCRACHAG